MSPRRAHPTLARLVTLVVLALLTATAALSQTGKATKAPAPTPKPSATPPAPVKRADDQTLDAIAAMVDDEPVLQSDVEEQLYLFLQRANAPMDSAEVDTLRRQILDQLIDERLVLAEAKRQGITVTAGEIDKAVDAEIANTVERLGGEEAFARQLQEENTDLASLKERYRAELEKQALVERVVRKSVVRRTNIPQAEAEKYFLANRDKFPRVPPQLRLQVLQLVPSADSTAVAEALRRTKALAQRIRAGEKFAKVAQEASEDPTSSKSGGDLGFFRRGEMEPSFENAAFTLPIGRLSEPVRTKYGWHLIEVIERDTVQTAAGRDSLEDGRPLAEAHVRHILLRVQVTEADARRSYELAQKVRGMAAAPNADFGALVKRYSQYGGQTGPDGDVGFVPVTQLPPNIRAGLQDLAPGGVSEVLQSAQGFNVFRVVDTKPARDYEIAEIAKELPGAVAQQMFLEKREAWVKTLRAKAQIEYR
jgi:peptidyl-prolyl cis-trans isomerase SurA